MRSCRTRLLTAAFFLVAIGNLRGASVPRPEFPQPQFERSQWMSLNGTWRFAFDDGDHGMDARWNAAQLINARNINVPYCFESKLSGIGDTGMHPFSWYQRTFVVPAAWKGKHTLLHFGAVYYKASVWLNGQFLGSHEGGNVPFSFDLTNAETSGPQTLTVRVENPPTDRSIARGKQYWEPKSKSIFYTRTSGIWQPVWLEATGSNYLDYVHVMAGQDGNAHFEAKLEKRVIGPPTITLSMQMSTVTKTATYPSSSALTFDVSLSNGSTEVAHKAGQVKEDRAIVDLHLDGANLWSPSSPNLYNVRYRVLSGGQVLDEVQSYIGFRTVSVANDRVTINGQPVYLKFLLDQGYWPDSVLTPPSEEAILKDIELVQAMGFNGVRKHQKVADPRFLYWADKRGLLVSGEIADAYEFNDEEVQRFTREWMEAMQRDWNHPSIIIWNAINESWGVPDLKQQKQQAFLKDTYELTHALDSTRLVIDNEGWEHTDETDLFAIHDYEKSGEAIYQRYKDVTAAGASLPKARREALLPGYRYNGTPLYLSEIGGIAFIAPGANVPAESWGYSGVEKTQQSALARLTQLYQGLAKLPNLAGICYTQLTDVEQEVNGLLTFDRQTKYEPAKIKALNELLKP